MFFLTHLLLDALSLPVSHSLCLISLPCPEPSFTFCSLVVGKAGAVELPIFSFFMGNIDTDSPNGVLTVGGVNQTHYEGDAYNQSVDDLRAQS